MKRIQIPDDYYEVELLRNFLEGHGIKAVEPSGETRIKAGDVIVLLGLGAGLTAAEERLLRGN